MANECIHTHRAHSHMMTKTRVMDATTIVDIYINSTEEQTQCRVNGTLCAKENEKKNEENNEDEREMTNDKCKNCQNMETIHLNARRDVRKYFIFDSST